jgi:putative MATE family efflux protein
VGKLGAQAITAVSIGVTAWWTLAYFFDGLRSAMVILVANCMGRQDNLSISRFLNAGFFLALASGLFFLLFSNAIAAKTCNMLSQDPVVIKLGTEFLQYLLPAAPFCFVMYVAEGFFRGIGNVHLPMLLSIVVTIVSVFLDWVLIDGHLGISAMGVRGAAIATSAAHVTGGILGFLFIIANRESRPYFLPDLGARRQLVKYAKIAVDTGIYSGLIQVAMLVFTAFLKDTGTVAQAANQVANEVFNISFLPPMGYMVTASMLVSTLVGRGQFHLIGSIVRKMLIISFCSVSLISIFSFLFSYKIAVFFSPVDVNVAALASRAIKIAAVNQVLCSLSLVFRGALLGLGKSSFVRYCGILATLFFFLPLAHYFVVTCHYGLEGGYVAFTLWTLFVLLLFAPAFYHYKKEMIHT